LRAEMTAASWLLLAAIGSTILIWNRSFIHLWVGDQHYAGTLANLLMVMMIVQLIFIRNDSYVIDLTLELREKVVMGVVAAVVSIALSAILIPRLGIAGLCLGMILGRLSLTISYPIVINKRFGRKRLPNLTSAARPALTMAVMFGGSAYLSQQLLVDNWLLWAACAGLTFCLTLGIAALVGLSGDVRRPLKKRLGMLRTVFESR
jgi:O-antigen/teichoic acid export membrane protein